MSNDPNDPTTREPNSGNVPGLGAPGPSGETGVENLPPAGPPAQTAGPSENVAPSEVSTPAEQSPAAPFTDPSTTGQDPVTGRRDVTTAVDPAFGAGEADEPSPNRSADEVADENARLRSELDEQNARLRAAVAESRAANADAEGLTDEDVRRIEHPEEFVDA